jgi:hypothetical protein
MEVVGDTSTIDLIKVLPLISTFQKLNEALAKTTDSIEALNIHLMIAGVRFELAQLGVSRYIQ